MVVASKTSGFDSSSILFTNDAKGEASAGFGVYHSGDPELSAIFVTFIQIRARHPGSYLIVTDNMSFCKGSADSKGCSKDSLVGI
jgi:hypothetical protein